MDPSWVLWGEKSLKGDDYPEFGDLKFDFFWKQSYPPED